MSILHRHAPVPESPPCPAVATDGATCPELDPGRPDVWCRGCSLDAAPCPSRRGYGRPCFEVHPDRPGRWCDRCRGAGPLAEWVDDVARMVARLGHGRAEWLAAQIADLAIQARHLGAETPDEFESRDEVMSAAMGGEF